MSAVASQLFAYGGVPSFFAIVAEMRDPKQYTRAMAVCQGVVSVFYLGIGVVVYYFRGSYVSSPALGSAGAMMKKVCYRLALPSLVFSVLLLTHVCYVPVRSCASFFPRDIFLLNTSFPPIN
jgi:hypothetical protein